MTTHPNWRKSSYSGTQENCVEVAFTASGVGIRDSKNATGPVLTFTRDSFAEFRRISGRSARPAA
jgi:uncharacterized protein DUF397